LPVTGVFLLLRSIRFIMDYTNNFWRWRKC